MSGYNAVLARNTDNAPAGFGPCSQTVAFSHYNHLSAQLPIDPASGAIVAGGAKEQATQCLANLKAVLESIDQAMDDVVRLAVFVADIEDADAVDEAAAAFFTDYVPVRTTVAVDALPQDVLVQIEALASNGVGSIPGAPQAGDLIKLARNTSNAPKDRNSTQTVAFSHYNHLSAQLPLDPAGAMIEGGVREQAQQCLTNVKAILESIDVPFDDIVKMTIFLTDLADLPAVNEVYTTFFPDSAIARTAAYVPARTIVAASALPKGALVQMEAIVSHGDGTPPQAVEDRHGLIVEPNNTDAAPRNALCTQTVAFSHYNHFSAQLPLDPAGTLVEGGIREQATQCLANIKAIAESVDHSLEDVVKINLYLTDLANAEAVDEVYAGFFPGGNPARRTVGVSELPLGALVMIEAVLGNAEGTPPLS